MADDSLFNTDATGETTPPVTPDPSTEDQGSPYEQLVGEGKRYKDNDALAASKLEGDRHIGNLESELAEMREELNKRLAVEDVLNRIEARQTPPQESSNPAPQEPSEQPENRGVSKDEIAKLIQDTIEQTDTLKTRKSNMDAVKSALTKKFGGDYASKVRAKLNELQLGEDFANGLAATQPKAFLALVGVDEVSTGASPEPSSTVRTELNPQSDKRNYAYYQKLRRENPSEYFSTRVTMQMHKDAMEQGDSFYN